MIIYLLGISCVGKTTIGKLLADYLDFEFYDLDNQIEEYFEKPLEYIQDEFITTNGYREKTSVVLNEMFNKDKDVVIASTPSGMRDYYLKQYKTTKKTKDIVSINLTDKPENILNRLTFYDKDSIQIEKKLSVNERKLYLKEIKKDITFFKKFNLRADYSIDINGATPEVFIKKITELLIEEGRILMKK
ncbi:MAG: shikimate kinase [Candidatus Cloacimonadota bacterium]|nr:shikimate kinase [Candidatus Cloacimonadota bacterium]